MLLLVFAITVTLWLIIGTAVVAICTSAARDDERNERTTGTAAGTMRAVRVGERPRLVA
jgi:hypothetical protein